MRELYLVLFIIALVIGNAVTHAIQVMLIMGTAGNFWYGFYKQTDDFYMNISGFLIGTGMLVGTVHLSVYLYRVMFKQIKLLKSTRS